MLPRLRGLTIPLTFIGARTMDASDPLMATVPFEIGVNSLMLLVGVAANALILMRWRAGVYLGCVSVAVTGLSLIVGIWQAGLQVSQLSGQAEMIGGFIGGGIMIVLRIVLIGLYLYAIYKFHLWLNATQELPRSSSRRT